MLSNPVIFFKRIKIYSLIIVASFIYACEDPPRKKSEVDQELYEILNAQPGDSIPLDFALQQYDSLFYEKNSTPPISGVHIQNRLDSLQKELLLDPENNFLKLEIRAAEESLDGLLLMEKVMDDIISRDSLIKQLVPEFDSLMSIGVKD